MPPSAISLYARLVGDMKADSQVLGELQLIYPDQAQGMYARAALAYAANPKDAEGPLALVDRALALNPAMGYALLLRGELRLKMRMPREAITDFSDALQLNIRPSGVYYNRALAYEMSGDIHMALRDWAEYTLLNPGDMKTYVLGERLFRALRRDKEANWCLFRAAAESMSWRKPHEFPLHVWNYFRYGWIMDNVDPDLSYISRGEGAAFRKGLEGSSELVLSSAESQLPPVPKSGLRLLTAGHRSLEEAGGFVKLYTAMSGDLYGYMPELSAKYATGRARQAYEQTPEHRDNLRKMHDFVVLARQTFISFEMRAPLSPYDEDLQGFFLPVASNRGLRAQAHHPANWGGFYIQSLPTVSLPAEAAEDQPRSYFLFIPADKELKVKLELAAPRLRARVLVKPDYAGQSPAYKFISTGPESSSMVLTIEDDCISVSDAGLLLLDGDKVLYSQSFY